MAKHLTALTKTVLGGDDGEERRKRRTKGISEMTKNKKALFG